MRYIVLAVFLSLHLSSAAKAIEVNDMAISCPAILESSNTLLDLEKYQGKVIYLDFWASWCPPCKQSMPFLNALRNELFDQGFEVIAINVDEDSENARKLLNQFPVNYIVAMDAHGECPKMYDVKAMPSAYFIDRKGIIRKIHLGFRHSDEPEIRGFVMKLLSEEQ